MATTPDIHSAPAPDPEVTRDAAGRFRTNATFHATLDAIADVVAHALQPGEEPTDIGRIRFDRSRVELGLALPSAQALAKRFRLPLAQLIQMAGKPAAARSRAAGTDDANEATDDFPKELMLRAIRAAGFRCGGVPGLRDYDRMVAADNDAREARHVPTNALPHSATIAKRFGSWDQALAEAGFEVTAAQVAREELRAEPAAVLLDRFMSEHGFLPSSGYFSDYCKASGIPLGRDLKPFFDVVEGARTRRAARGEATPAAMLPPAQRPPIEDIATGGGGRKPKAATKEQAIAALRAYRMQLRSGEAPTYRGYKDFCKGRADAPAASTIQRNWGFATLIEEAGL